VLHAIETLGGAAQVVAAGYPMKGVRFVRAHDETLIAARPSIRAPGVAHLRDLGIARPAIHAVLDRAAREAGAKLRFGVT
jgi:hypothetical protein